MTSQSEPNWSTLMFKREPSKKPKAIFTTILFAPFFFESLVIILERQRKTK
jgi:hypothetical protein